MFQNPEQVLLIASVILFLSIFAGKAGYAEVKPIASQGVVLATLGVLATTFITGGFIYWLFGLFGKYVTLTFPESLLLAAVMSSTDSASVFSILRSKGVYLKERLRPTLELESGSNDPMAYMLTLLLIAYILGRLAVLIINKIDIDNESLYPILLLATAFFTFAATTLCKGNGYLAVYIAGLVVGNAKIVHKKSMGTFFDGFAWLWQIVMFLTLGLLVNPHELLPVTGVGVMVGVFMILIARPISVFLCLIPYKNFSFKGTR